MVKITKTIFLKREAVLFDTPLFIAKSFSAVLIGYVIFSGSDFIGRDMISMLLGLMLALQPVNISGLKSALDQVTASLIGGGVTAVIILIGGVNFITVPLAVAATLYITLRINWRGMSVIAVFTSIYMTQYIQYTAAGEPSVFLTLGLRFSALGAGILIAIAMNFLFSFIFYRSMMKKRTIFTVEQLRGIAGDFSEFVSAGGTGELQVFEKRCIELFGDIDYITSSIAGIGSRRAGVYPAILKELRDINHYILDMLMIYGEDGIEKNTGNDFREISSCLDGLDKSLAGKGEFSLPQVPGGVAGRNMDRIRRSFDEIISVIDEKVSS